MAKTSSDRNLLLGLTALRANLVSRDQLIEAMNAWWLDQAKSLGEILVQQQVLTEKRRRLLEALVLEHVESHHHDPQLSLAAVCSQQDDLSDVSSGFLPDLQEYLGTPATTRAVSPAACEERSTPNPHAPVSIDHATQGARLRRWLRRQRPSIWAAGWALLVVAMISLTVILLVRSI